MIRTVIGLDPGRQTGICVWSAVDGARLQTVDLGGPSMGTRLRVLWEFASFAVQGSATEILVAYEEPARMQGAAGQQIAQYLGVIRLWCEIHEVASYPVNQSTLKAWAARANGHKGKVTKDEMIAWAYDHGAEPADDNQADAYWLARYGWEMVVPNMGVDT